jgi:hypothetical protein
VVQNVPRSAWVKADAASVCVSKGRRVCRFAGSVGFHPRTARYILYPQVPTSEAIDSLMKAKHRLCCSEAEKASAMYGLDHEVFLKALTKPRVKVGTEWVSKGQNLEQVQLIFSR